MENDSAWTQEDEALLQAMEAHLEAAWAAVDATRERSHRDQCSRQQPFGELEALVAKIRVYESYIEELRAKRERSQDAGISDATSGLVFISSLVVFACFRIYRSLSS